MPLFVFDEALLGSRFAAPNRLATCSRRCATSTSSLRQRGGRLFVRRGDPVAEAIAVARESGAEQLHVERRLERLARRRERRLAAGLRGGADPALPPSRRHGRPARRRHPRRRRPLPGLHPLPPRLERDRHCASGRRRRGGSSAGQARAGRLPALDSLTGGSTSPRARAGRRDRGARRLMQAFLRERLGRLRRAPRRPRRRRHLAAQPLPALRLPLAAGAAAGGARRPGGGPSRASSAGATSTTKSSPPTPTSPAATTGRAATAGPARRGRFEAWREGRTGYPLVDAAMRQLAARGSCTTGHG